MSSFPESVGTKFLFYMSDIIIRQRVNYDLPTYIGTKTLIIQKKLFLKQYL